MLQQYWDMSPSDPVSAPWADELVDLLEPALDDPQIRLLLDPETQQLIQRLSTAPRLKTYFERVDRADIRPVPFIGAEEGFYRDEITGLEVVEETYPRHEWFRARPFPKGAITAGELVRLDWLLWAAVERVADLADVGALSDRQRKAAVDLVKAADYLALRLRLLQLHADPETAAQIKQMALDILAEGRPGLRLVNETRGFHDRKHDWKEVLVATPETTLTRGRLRDLYMRNAKSIVDDVKDGDALVLLGIGHNNTVPCRRGPDGRAIRITKAHGIEDPHSLEYWANRRLVEIRKIP